MKEITSLSVTYKGHTVGTLAETTKRKVAFQYSREWLINGFSISPLSLPLTDKLFSPSKDTFDGLFGVFDDSLPDGWGRLLVDRMLLKEHVRPDAVSQICRLGIVGCSGMGALEYKPELMEHSAVDIADYDHLSDECMKVLDDRDIDDLDALVHLGGSSGGARPKAFIDHDNDKWLIKFPSKDDRKDIGMEEFRYMKCAKECGINVPDVKLFASRVCSGYFGAKRYDRMKYADGTTEKIHAITAGGLLETSHRIPNLDYEILMKLTAMLTKDYQQLEELYRRMCFNVFAHNRDDHAKNFSYLYDEEHACWRLSPAYDLTYSNSIGGEHATTVNGNGVDPGMRELLAVAVAAGIPEKKALAVAADIQDIVHSELKDIIISHQ